MSGFKLFRLFGIDVRLHWTWLLVAFYEINTGKDRYDSIAWGIAEYCTLFLIVLLHEFGHALACKSVGGEANRILLWPLGGVAYVKPPPRPGPILWSIAAGPLVNVILLPVTIGAYLFVRFNYPTHIPDFRRFLFYVAAINVLLLVFNMLPIYPLDGGQILRALLWLVIGPSRSLFIASVIGLVAGIGILVWGLVKQQFWFVVLAAFGLLQSWGAIQNALRMGRLRSLPRHEEIACPACRTPPPAVALWQCACGAAIDPFASNGICPNCGRAFEVTPCPHCGQAVPSDQWIRRSRLHV